MHWVIEKMVFPQTADRLIAALDARGLPWSDLGLPRDASELCSHAGPALFYGSLNVGGSWELPWKPGAIFEEKPLLCSSYYPRLQGTGLLLNCRFAFSTVAELCENRFKVLSQLPYGDRFFVRPDSPLKHFSGRVVHEEKLSLEALDHGYYYQDENIPILVAPAQKIGKEWRCVVSEDRVLAATGYDDGKPTSDPVPPGVTYVAVRCAEECPVAPIFVVDSADTDWGPRVVELNSFSCSDLYGCEWGPVVEAVEKLQAEGKLS